MSSEIPTATKDGYSALSKSDLAQFAKELGLFEQGRVPASLSGGYDNERTTKNAIINGLRNIEVRFGPILRHLRLEDSRLVVYNPLECLKPPSMYDDLLPSRHTMNSVKLNRLREAEIILPSKPHFDFNNGVRPTDVASGWPLPQEWITGLGRSYRFLCSTCSDDLMGCDCKSTNDYVVAFLRKFLMKEGYGKGESFLWSLKLRFPETKLIEANSVKADSIKFIEPEDWLQIPIIKNQPLTRFWDSKRHRSPNRPWSGNVRSINNIAYLSPLAAFSAGIDKRLKKVLLNLRNVIATSQWQWYCTSCTLPVIGLDTCFICGIGTKKQAIEIQRKLDDESDKVNNIADINYRTVTAYRKKMSETRRQEEIVKKRAAASAMEIMMTMTRKEKNEAKLYLDQGLEIEFVIPLITGIIPAEELMEFWECEWRKQYSSDDSLVRLVLNGGIGYQSATLLNKVRSTSDEIYQFAMAYNIAFTTAIRVEPITKKVQRAHWALMLEEIMNSISNYETLDGVNRERAVLAEMSGVGWETIATHLGPWQTDRKPIMNGTIQSTNPPKDSSQSFKTQFSIPSSWGKSHLHLQEFYWTNWNRLYFGHLLLGIEPRIAKAYANKIVKEKSTMILDTFCLASWPKQYDVGDYLIKAFLDEKLNFKQVTILNSIRSNHELLVRAVTLHPNIYQWALDLLDAGFDKYPEAAIAALFGAEPLVLEKLHRMEGKSPLPPALNMDLKEIDLQLEIKWLEKSIDFKT